MFGSFKQSLDTMSGLICPSCGCTPVIFKETGRLGCESCYAALKPLIDGVIENSQKGMSHVGKRPNASTTHCACGDACDSSAPPESQGGSAGDMDGLKVELERAVSEERYEDAAKLRDEIKKLSK
jgi:protein arginine kinase activator